MTANKKKPYFDFSVTHGDASRSLNIQSNSVISHVGPSQAHTWRALLPGKPYSRHCACIGTVNPQPAHDAGTTVMPM